MDTLIEKLIEKYVSKIDKKDIIKFAEENNVTLNQNEVDLIYDNIKLHWKQIIFNDHNIVLEKIKNKKSKQIKIVAGIGCAIMIICILVSLIVSIIWLINEPPVECLMVSDTKISGVAEILGDNM